MEREQRNGGQRTETDWLASSAANSPAYRVRVSLNELANCSQRCTRSVLPCSSDPCDITIQKEKARYSGQEKERGRKRKRKRKRKRETVRALRSLPSCNFYDPRKTAIFTDSACIGSTFSLCLFSAFLHFLPIFLFL